MKPIVLFIALPVTILVWSFAIYGAIGLFTGW
jgi:hypothetical protein